ncbi:MAG: DNA polymerase IV [Firmicutes bacterium]|nr:DNA polymerase IV [Bacillota bacterium]
MDRSIIHVDMDAFFASIEQRDNPKLRNKPVAVGGKPNKRGVVCAASYEARRYGVKSAMSSKRAERLCPKLIFVSTNKDKYKEVSKHIKSIFKRYSEKIEPISIDEAFIDVTGKEALKIGKLIKKSIKNELDLTASIGISYNKFLSKLASDMDKPNGFTVISKKNAKDILKKLPIRKLWGVGPKTEKELSRLGLYKIEDIQRYDRDILVEKFGKRGLELIEFANGKDDRPIEWKSKSQSIGEENTFSHDTLDMEVLHNTLNKYSLDVLKKIRKNRYKIKTITIKIKYENFNIETRSLTLKAPTDSLEVIKSKAHFILNNKFNINKKVRLLGLTVSNIVYPNDPVQLRMDMDDFI